MSQQFYMQDKRGYQGNFLWFWKKGRCGYTSDIREAEVFTEEDALSQNRCRDTDIPWLKSYIDGLGDQCIDMQKVNRAEMLKLANVELIQEVRVIGPRKQLTQPSLGVKCVVWVDGEPMIDYLTDEDHYENYWYETQLNFGEEDHFMILPEIN